MIQSRDPPKWNWDSWLGGGWWGWQKETKRIVSPSRVNKLFSLSLSSHKRKHRNTHTYLNKTACKNSKRIPKTPTRHGTMADKSNGVCRLLELVFLVSVSPWYRKHNFHIELASLAFYFYFYTFFSEWKDEVRRLCQTSLSSGPWNFNRSTDLVMVQYPEEKWFHFDGQGSQFIWWWGYKNWHYGIISTTLP